jgi:hypothetical protein
MWSMVLAVLAVLAVLGLLEGILMAKILIGNADNSGVRG